VWVCNRRSRPDASFITVICMRLFIFWLCDTVFIVLLPSPLFATPLTDDQYGLSTNLWVSMHSHIHISKSSKSEFNTHISKSEFKNGHISGFCSVFQVIQVISSAKFFSAEEVDLSFNSETKEHSQISNPAFWKGDHENVFLQMF